MGSRGIATGSARLQFNGEICILARFISSYGVMVCTVHWQHYPSMGYPISCSHFDEYETVPESFDRIRKI